MLPRPRIYTLTSLTKQELRIMGLENSGVCLSDLNEGLGLSWGLGTLNTPTSCDRFMKPEAKMR